ncbi:uncharacterized protein LOC142766922 [Rhipicephalus microplus]|uniref:uncharacterized protein LOC142766922 n=1 Tax=Rhipicephalus microplus TaxID=6941 RepID=UPI003F6C215F
MSGFTTGLFLLLFAALSCRNQVSLASKYVSERKPYSDVTPEPGKFSDRSSDGEGDDWEEHHEWTYTELDDDDDDARGERKTANSGYHHYSVNSMDTEAEVNCTEQQKV